MIAQALGFEPRSKVLETRMLPLHHACKGSPKHRFRTIKKELFKNKVP